MRSAGRQNPYLGLWSRLEGFRPDEVSTLLVERHLVRMVVMRATVHLVSADDALTLRPLAQPVLDQELVRHSEHAPKLVGVDLDPVLAVARALLDERPRSGPELRHALAERFPDHDAAALAYACRNHLALVQVPPRGLWRRSGQVTTTTAEAWLGRPLATDASLDEVVLRYLAAYGPSTAADLATWSRLTGLRAVVERLRPRLRSDRDERGRELLDVPDAPRPDPDTPAPVRILAEYDNAMLSHADRSRWFGDEDRRRRLYAAEGPVHGTVLHDGSVAGTWRVDGSTLLVDHVGPVVPSAREEIEAEEVRVLAFLAPAHAPGVDGHDVRVVPRDT